MFRGKSYIYTVFPCHLAVEKALKGVYFHKRGKQAPKTHNLMYLIEETGIELPYEVDDFITSLSGASVPTRYPDEIQRMMKNYDGKNTREIISKSERAIQCIKELLKKQFVFLNNA